MPSDSISEGLIFQNFLGGMPPDPLDLACFACQIVYFAHNYHAHSNKIVPPPPFQNPGSAPGDSQLKISSHNERHEILLNMYHSGYILDIIFGLGGERFKNRSRLPGTLLLFCFCPY